MDPPKDIKREAAAILNEAMPADSAPSKKPAYLKTPLISVIIIVTIAGYNTYAFITRPKGSTVKALFMIFNVNLNWLFSGKGDPYLEDLDQPSENANLIMEPENE